MVILASSVQSAALCSVFTVFISTYRLHTSVTPRGECDNCCEIRETNDIKFFLYNQKYQKNGKQIFLNDAKGLKNLNKKMPLAIFVHGFTDSSIGPSTLSAMKVKDAFMEIKNYSVILVDWSPIAAFPWYLDAVNNAPRVSRYISRFIKFLVKSGVLLENIHLIGFSLGAEISGFIGKTLKDWGILLPRITGIDPAGPMFMNGDTTTRISRSDAKFVDIIHTDGGILGMPWAVGHADFFPNGGFASQPGCINESLSRNNIIGIVAGCSHTRALLFFAESIRRPHAFPADRCDPTNNESAECKEGIPAFMGLAADKRLRGKFYLTTNAEEPYGRGV
ncbi:lipase member H-like isoform X1 [Chironomus tepperi]|uniref:lipase member H-like isoform X1 n=2 Tax=Chironomus tepperi TaxID=113505 RepID=UPI00391F6DDE